MTQPETEPPDTVVRVVFYGRCVEIPYRALSLRPEAPDLELKGALAWFFDVSPREFSDHRVEHPEADVYEVSHVPERRTLSVSGALSCDEAPRERGTEARHRAVAGALR